MKKIPYATIIGLLLIGSSLFAATIIGGGGGGSSIDLSSPPPIGNGSPNTVSATTVTAESFATNRIASTSGVADLYDAGTGTATGGFQGPDSATTPYRLKMMNTRPTATTMLGTGPTTTVNGVAIVPLYTVTVGTNMIATATGPYSYALSSTGTGTDTLGSLSCATNEIPKWTGSTWACAADNAGSGSYTLTTSLITTSGTWTTSDFDGAHPAVIRGSNATTHILPAASANMKRDIGLSTAATYTETYIPPSTSDVIRYNGIALTAGHRLSCNSGGMMFAYGLAANDFSMFGTPTCSDGGIATVTSNPTTTVDWGTISSAATGTITFTNSGTASSYLLGMTLSTPTTTAYSLYSSTCATGTGLLASSASCTIGILFTPQTSVTSTGTWTVAWDQGRTMSINLIGIGAAGLTMGYDWEGTASGSQNVGDSSPDTYIATLFYTSASCNVKKISTYGARIGSYGANTFTAAIYSVTSSTTMGSLIGSESTAVVITSFPSTTSNIDFTFGSAVSTSATTTYAVVVRTYGTADASNYWKWDYPSTVLSSLIQRSANGSTWSAQQNRRAMITLWCE